MIGTFWNLCRACPSIPIDKNRSEYRSTYQWYEYTGPRQEVVKQAPQPIMPMKSGENGLKGGVQAVLININKKDGGKRHKDNAIDGIGNTKPEVNIKQNPIFDKKEASQDQPDNAEALNRVTINPTVRVRSRNDRRDCAPSRRSKSEGPPGRAKQRGYCAVYGSPSPDRAELPEFEADYAYINNCANEGELDTTNGPTRNPRGNTEYRLQFAWPRSKNAADTQEELKPAGGGSRRSAFMATIGHEKPAVPVHKKRTNDAKKREGVAEGEPLVDLNGDCENYEERKNKIAALSPNERIEFHSEYQKKFRPFSQYDYIAGKFLARDIKVTPASNLATESWFAEVIELRKKAGEYRHRGWGTELVPQHLAEVYNKQIALWEHVSRRSSLSALTLATTTQKPRMLTKAEKTQENNRKFKLNEVDRASMGLRKKTEKNEELKRDSEKAQKDFLDGRHVENYAPISSARSQSNARSSPKKGLTRAASAGSPKKPIAGQKEHQSRPTTLATNTHPTRISTRDTSVSARKKNPLSSKVFPAAANNANDAKRNQSRSHRTTNEKTDDTIDNNETNQPADIEHIIKSPPEPTRVKSPEQIMMNSPEPVNWTVPLDTGKTFTVTQNIMPDGDTLHHRPISETKLLQHGLSHLTDGQDSSASHQMTEDATVSASEKEVDGAERVNGAEKSLTETLSEESSVMPLSVEEKQNAVDLSGPMSIMNIAESVNSSDHFKSSTVMPSRSLDIPEEWSPASTPSSTSAMPISDKTSSAEVLDSGRNRFDQFWNKTSLNGKKLDGQDSSV